MNIIGRLKNGMVTLVGRDEPTKLKTAIRTIEPQSIKCDRFEYRSRGAIGQVFVDGVELPYVRGFDIRMRVGEYVTATVEVIVDDRMVR